MQLTIDIFIMNHKLFDLTQVSGLNRVFPHTYSVSSGASSPSHLSTWNKRKKGKIWILRPESIYFYRMLCNKLSSPRRSCTVSPLFLRRLCNMWWSLHLLKNNWMSCIIIEILFYVNCPFRKCREIDFNCVNSFAFSNFKTFLLIQQRKKKKTFFLIF